MQTANQQPHVTVTGRHLAITAALNEYAEKKIESLHLDYPKIIEAHVILEVDKHRHRAEIVLVCANHITIEAHEECSDLYASMDQVISKIARQMRKYKTRLLRQQRPRNQQQSIRFLEEQVFDPEAFAVFDEAAVTARGYTEPPEPEMLQTEKRPVKSMYVDEAVLQLEVAKDQQFFVFHNSKTDSLNVLYRRKKGDFGLIQPTVN